MNPPEFDVTNCGLRMFATRIVFDCSFRSQPIATGPGLTAWFMPMELDPDSPMVTSWEPGRRLGVRTPPAEDGSFQTFDYRLEAEGPGRTRLRFAHSGFTGDGWGDGSATGPIWGPGAPFGELVGSRPGVKEFAGSGNVGPTSGGVVASAPGCGTPPASPASTCPGARCSRVRR